MLWVRQPELNTVGQGGIIQLIHEQAGRTSSKKEQPAGLIMMRCWEKALAVLPLAFI